MQRRALPVVQLEHLGGASFLALVFAIAPTIALGQIDLQLSHAEPLPSRADSLTPL
jgi:hypothetical protein